jgi:5-methyltetrahydrofolate--homocysteine methyltransferase
MNDFARLTDAVVNGNIADVKDITQKMIDIGTDPLLIINEGLIGGMNIVGEKFKAGDMYVPEVMLAARAMSVGMDLAKLLIAEADIPSAGTIVIGTVKGDLHDIGKNLVVMVLESSGFKVINLGVDVSPSAFVVALQEFQPHILGMSALLTTTMTAMKDTIDALREAGLRDKVKVIIGGAPVSQRFAEEIGADGYCDDVMTAKDMCTGIMSRDIAR